MPRPNVLYRARSRGCPPSPPRACSTTGCLRPICPQAEHPPYDLPPRYAAMAAAAFREMQQRGLQPNVVVWHSLMACQVWPSGQSAPEPACTCSHHATARRRRTPPEGFPPFSPRLPSLGVVRAASARMSRTTARLLGSPPPRAPQRRPSRFLHAAVRPRPRWRTKRSAPTAPCWRPGCAPPCTPSPSWCLPAVARASRSAPLTLWSGSCRRWAVHTRLRLPAT